MSYINPSATDATWGTNFSITPTTPMMADIAAIQRIYGKPTTGPLASGGQRFGFNSKCGRPRRDLFRFHEEASHHDLGWRPEQHPRLFGIYSIFTPSGNSYKNPLRKTSHDIGHMTDQTTALP